MSRVLLFSGGLDSLALWFLTDRPDPVYVQLGHRYEHAEMETLRVLSTHVPGFRPRYLRGPQIGGLEETDGHIPHRNAALLVTAAAYTGADEVMLGALLGEASPDKSRRFLRYASLCLTASTHRPVRCWAPAARWTKTGLLARFLRAYPAHTHLLRYTRSCYAVSGECGACPACFRRHVALWHCGLREERPQLPATASAGAAWAAARRAGVARWPGLAVNNTLAGLALAGVRAARPPRRLP